MSIEALIREQIEALKANTAAVLLLEASLVGRAGGNSKSAKEEKPKTEKPTEILKSEVEEPKAEVKEQAKPDTVEEPATAAAATEEQPLTYDDLRDLVLLLAKSGKREEIKSTFASHGIESGKDLLEKADDPATVKDTKKLAEVYADMKKLEA